MKTLKKSLASVLLVVLILSCCSVAFAATAIYTTGNCFLRTGPGLRYSTITTVPKGVALSAIAHSYDNRGVKWYKVKYEGKTGYVSSVYTKKGSEPSHKKVVIATGDTYIRSKANKSSAKLGVLYAGCRATYLNKSSVDSRGVRWYKITYGGITGYVSSVNSYIK